MGITIKEMDLKKLVQMSAIAIFIAFLYTPQTIPNNEYVRETTNENKRVKYVILTIVALRYLDYTHEVWGVFISS